MSDFVRRSTYAKEAGVATVLAHGSIYAMEAGVVSDFVQGSTYAMEAGVGTNAGMCSVENVRKVFSRGHHNSGLQYVG